MKLVDVKTVAEMLGVKEKTVYDWTHRRLMPYHKVGRLLRFDPDEIERWVKEKQQARGN